MTDENLVHLAEKMDEVEIILIIYHM